MEDTYEQLMPVFDELVKGRFLSVVQPLFEEEIVASLQASLRDQARSRIAQRSQQAQDSGSRKKRKRSAEEGNEDDSDTEQSGETQKSKRRKKDSSNDEEGSAMEDEDIEFGESSADPIVNKESPEKVCWPFSPFLFSRWSALPRMLKLYTIIIPLSPSLNRPHSLLPTMTSSSELHVMRLSLNMSTTRSTPPLQLSFAP